VFLSWAGARYEGLLAKLTVREAPLDLARADMAHRCLLAAAGMRAKGPGFPTSRLW
jgi:hypothetical protein